MGQGLPDPTAAPDVDSRLWSEAIGRTFAERVVPGLRIPGADDYLTDLAKGASPPPVGTAPDKAPAGVARAWTERTKARGPKRQLWHYHRSLNLRATAPAAPGRLRPTLRDGVDRGGRDRRIAADHEAATSRPRSRR